jgi:ATP-dependent Clp protease ATP-binding subunit ClpC
MLRQSFRPELLNRIDEIIVFRSLDRDQLMQITRLLLGRVARRIHGQGVELFRVDLRDGRLNVETALQAVAAGQASETGARA